MKLLKVLPCIVILSIQSSFAQNNELNAYLEKVDLTGLKNQSFLNKAVLDSDLLEKIRKKEIDIQKNEFLNIEKQDFKAYLDIVEQADLSSTIRSELMIKLINRPRGQITQSNTIPIGIINVESTYLTAKQIEENIYAKANKLAIDFDKYKFLLIKKGIGYCCFLKDLQPYNDRKKNVPKTRTL